MSDFLVTGANGFLGAALCARLAGAGHRVVATVRTEERKAGLAPSVRAVAVGEVGPETDWSPALEEGMRVIHLAGRAHRMRESPEEAEEAHDRVNAQGTRRLSEQACEAGVARIVLASSIKAMGEGTRPGAPWTPDSPCAPEDAYGRSKLRAERLLAETCAGRRTEWTALRLPLVYGPGVRANFLALMRAVARRRPVPLVDSNRRSILGLTNFCSVAEAAATRCGAAGRIFLPSDAEAVSTSALIRALGRALGVRPLGIPVPAFALRLLPGGLGRRIAASLEVDRESLRSEIGWTPPRSLAEELDATATWYREQESAS